MKLKHFAAGFIFLASFTLSVLIVGLPAYKTSSFNAPCKKNQTVQRTDTDLQIRIRKFLEADFQTGIELANDKARLSSSNGSEKAEKLATLNLVQKMEKATCDGLPEDFCNAWGEHVVAWKYKSFLLDRYWKNGWKDYEIANEQITKSYQKMLAAARKHGVDFRY